MRKPDDPLLGFAWAFDAHRALAEIVIREAGAEDVAIPFPHLEATRRPSEWSPEPATVIPFPGSPTEAETPGRTRWLRAARKKRKKHPTAQPEVNP